MLTSLSTRHIVDSVEDEVHLPNELERQYLYGRGEIRPFRVHHPHIHGSIAGLAFISSYTDSVDSSIMELLDIFNIHFHASVLKLGSLSVLKLGSLYPRPCNLRESGAIACMFSGAKYLPPSISGRRETPAR